MARSSEQFVTIVVAFAVFTDCMIYDMVIPFLPDLFAGRLRIPVQQVPKWAAWSLEAFGIASLISNIVAGYITDRSNSKSRPFILGIAAMLASTLMFFISTTPELVILARAIQGASTALVWVSGIALVVSRVSEQTLGLCMGYVTIGATFGELLGPLLGGPLYDKLGHWAVFGVVEVLIAADIGLRLLITDETEEKKTTIPENQASETDALLGNQQLEVSKRDARSPRPVDLEDCADTTDLSNADVAESDSSALTIIAWKWITSVLATTMAASVRCALEVTMPIFAHQRFSWSSSASGVVMFALLLPTILGPMVGRYVARDGPRWWSVGAFSLCGGLMMSLGNLTDGGPATQNIFVLHVILIGVGIAIATSAHGTAILVATQSAEMLVCRAQRNSRNSSWGLRWLTPGMMVSGLSTAWSLGMFIGPACADAIHYTKDEDWAWLCRLLGGSCIVTGIATLFFW